MPTPAPALPSDGPTAHRAAPERPAWGEATRPVTKAAPGATAGAAAVPQAQAPAPADATATRPDDATAAPQEVHRAGRDGPTVRLTRPTAGGVRRLILSDLAVGSVFRLALGLYLAVFTVVLAAGIVLWFLLSAAGVVGQIEGFLGELLGYEDYRFLGWRILQYFVLVGLLWVTVAAGATALLALIYNRVSRIVGGLQVTVEDD